ncbi:cytochrome c maturation protein CcmE [Spartinivicinus poritis]|uniref:Cytochrome c-type biogenesis protein CcmE n=1 Tax=Spartinivicinus poritis TaxID=2994640 RepID=A0ABT5U5A2_9GAMM|nr:cytochrome c maturation protein CcmE [Spartinivicinus sp. A2-2]MDE1461538.1 cytochrome c maturation protein CcmE [Spartinivicinus sp. A2-2]
MNPVRKQRLLVVIFIVLGVSLAVGLALFALQENVNYFYSPQQLQAGEAKLDQKIRVGGLVVPGSVKRDPESLKVEFTITDQQATAVVRYEGILPDLFREGQGIIALGRLSANQIVEADEVLAKHDENYMPPEVQEALEKAGHPGRNTQASAQ